MPSLNVVVLEGLIAHQLLDVLHLDIIELSVVLCLPEAELHIQLSGGLVALDLAFEPCVLLELRLYHVLNSSFVPSLKVGLGNAASMPELLFLLHLGSLFLEEY